MDTFIGLVVFGIFVFGFLYVTNEKFKAKIDALVHKPTTKPVETVLGVLDTPVANEPQKPVLEAPVKPEAPVSVPPTNLMGDYLKPTAEAGAILDSRVGDKPNDFGPLTPVPEGLPFVWDGQRHKQYKLKKDVTYSMRFDSATFIMIVVGEGMGAMLTTGKNAPGNMGTSIDTSNFDSVPGDVMYLSSSKDCIIWVD